MDLATPSGMSDLFEKVARGQIVQAIERLDELTSKLPRAEDAWNATALELTQAASAHVRYFVIAENARAIYSNPLSAEVKHVLTKLFHLMSLTWIARFAGDFQIFGGLSPSDLKSFNRKFTGILSELRPIAVSLVDAFDIHDQSLLSTLGAYDGQVYQRMFDAALKSPLNKSDVLPAYQKYIKPVLKANI